jgi:Fe2+ or Zn2+ uptake regulation protein
MTPMIRRNVRFGSYVARKIGQMPEDHRHEDPPSITTIRGGGRRMTQQRQAIWDLITDDPDSHLSAEGIADRLPSIHKATVYRTLELLVDEGLLLRTDLGGDRAYYEPAREHPHHHLVCERCGKVSHIHDEELGDLRRRVQAATGYVLGSRDISFYGLCPTCQTRA